jgi:hypothetical protein
MTPEEEKEFKEFDDLPIFIGGQLREIITAWIAGSHYWVNEYQTFHCKWCGKLTTTLLEGDAYLCPKNPAIIEALKKGNI